VDAVDVLDYREAFGNLVGSADLSKSPVHRWFAYKEGFSPALLGAFLDAWAPGASDLRVVDPFGGVATTALASQRDARVTEVRSVEYSPLAHFVGLVKVTWPELEPSRLRALLPRALAYPRRGSVEIPGLAAFSNPEIFHPARIGTIVRARNHVSDLHGATLPERQFFLVGLAAVLEDLSGVMKDGRALRIVGDRRRRATSLARHPPAVPVSGAVKRSLAGQWTAMIEDLESWDSWRTTARQTRTECLRGDARRLHELRLPDGHDAFPEGWATVGCFSPPYLNCIDYTEVHKLELWMLEFVSTKEDFRRTRLGTLRSHPSVKFPESEAFKGVDEAVVDFVESAGTWITDHGARRDVGPIVKQYFEDMLRVWRELFRTLQPGGIAACIVGNSTLARRDLAADGTREEAWRFPMLTDVILAHLARTAGMVDVQVWHARDLRPRNIRGGAARESIVVASRP
jgi:hypothetical protein